MAATAARQEYFLPILHQFKHWLDGEKDVRRLLTKSPLRSAFTYTLNQWGALSRYMGQGYLSFDNNMVERLVKLAAIGRRNYLFVGSPTGRRRPAFHFSLVSSAKANGADPFDWLKESFSRLPFHCDATALSQAAGESVISTELDYLLPDVWLAANFANFWDIEAIRREERPKKVAVVHITLTD